MKKNISRFCVAIISVITFAVMTGGANAQFDTVQPNSNPNPWNFNSTQPTPTAPKVDTITGSSIPTSGGTSTSTGSGYNGTYCKDFSGTLKLGSGSSLSDIIKFITCFLLRLIVPLLFAVAIVVFILGVIRFMNSESSEEKGEGKKFMLWGIIALTVMLGIWGIVSIVGGTFGIRNVIPQLPVNGQ